LTNTPLGHAFAASSRNADPRAVVEQAFAAAGQNRKHQQAQLADEIGGQQARTPFCRRQHSAEDGSG
jgi:hypothetical protein